MLTTASITAETFSAALLGLEDLSLRVTAAAPHVAANPEKHPRSWVTKTHHLNLVSPAEKLLSVRN